MAEEVSTISNGMLGAAWASILTIWLGVMGYFAKKRDQSIDDNGKAVTALELKVAENYATKPTVLALFQEATMQTKDAVARVEKSIDATNTSVGKLDSKMDKVFDAINAAQSRVMTELVKKT